MKQVILTAEGSSIEYSGGWACILRCGNGIREFSGSKAEASAPHMELRAVLEGLKALLEPCEVLVRTHSSYVCDGMTRWMKGWRQRGFQKKAPKSKRTDILYRDDWMLLDQLLGKHTVIVERLRGETSYSDTNRCDRLANHAARAAGV
jgi:ribonuclease HI